MENEIFLIFLEIIILLIWLYVIPREGSMSAVCRIKSQSSLHPGFFCSLRKLNVISKFMVTKIGCRWLNTWKRIRHACSATLYWALSALMYLSSRHPTMNTILYSKDPLYQAKKRIQKRSLPLANSATLTTSLSGPGSSFSNGLTI